MKTQMEDGTLKIYPVGRIDSVNAADLEKELFAAVDEASYTDILLDAGGLEYISSAGLRVLLKLRKQVGKSINIINVSPEVYDIFEVTGFSELFDVKKALRQLSIDGCEKIGNGATASVYRINPEIVVKVFKPNVDIGMVERENAKSKAAFLAGIPTAISFDTVKVGDCYGTVFELLNAVDLLKILETDRDHLENHIEDFAKEIKSLHQIEVDPEQFYDVRKTSLAMMPKLVGLVGTKEEIDILTQMYEIMPERHTFLHGDCHPGNIMIQDGNYIFIDLSSGGMGHPIIDLTSMCLTYKMPAMGDDYETRHLKYPHLKNFNRDEALLIWNTFLKTYLDTDDEMLIKKAEWQTMAYSALRILFAAVSLPGLFPKERLQASKHLALKYCEHLEPICF